MELIAVHCACGVPYRHSKWLRLKDSIVRADLVGEHRHRDSDVLGFYWLYSPDDAVNWLQGGQTEHGVYGERGELLAWGRCHGTTRGIPLAPE